MKLIIEVCAYFDCWGEIVSAVVKDEKEGFGWILEEGV